MYVLTATLYREFVGIKAREKPSHQLIQLDSVEVITHSFKATVANPIFSGQRWKKNGNLELGKFVPGTKIAS